MEKHSVIVVGAGPAGITAARELKAAGVDVVVLEAGPRMGGRLFNTHESDDPEVRAFSKFPLEMGAEFLHGSEKNVLLDYIQKVGVRGKPETSTMALAWPNYLYYGKEGKLIDEDGANKDEDLQRMFKIFDMLGEMKADLVPEESLLQYLVRMGVPSRVLDMADAIIANDYAAVLSEVGVKETVHEQAEWKYGEDYLVLDGCNYSDILKDMAYGLDIRTNWPVKEVAYAAGQRKVAVTSHKGQAMTADRVIVAVPQSVLKDGDIEFKPQMPRDKVEAISRVKMGNAMKVMIKLSERVWPKDMWDCVCADCFVPEIWVSPAAKHLKGADLGGEYIIVGFLAGSRTERIKGMSKDEITRLMLQQLDTMFGNQIEAHPATKKFVSSIVVDWSTQPLFRGAYTHPSLHAHGCREKMAEPLHSRVFFAGEGMNTGINPCINGAMETGTDACKAVLASLNAPGSGAKL